MNDRFEHFKQKNSKDEMTVGAKKAYTIFIIILFMMLLKYKPYHFCVAHTESSIAQNLFYVYFFLFNQTIGIIHEAGHGVCYILPCPRWLGIANGTFFQLLFPLGVGIYYFKRSNPIGGYSGIFFLGFSLRYSAWYASTSDEGPILPASKSFLGVDGYHDFYYMFDSLGVLEHYIFISDAMAAVAYVLMFAGAIGLFVASFK